MAAEGLGGEDSIGKFLAQVRFYVSAAALVIQVWITPRIHRYLGIGFALLMLPTTLAVTATAILLTGVPWAAAIARISDQSLRYSVDKTTREVLFLPLPSELRQEVKPLVDVTVDRVSRGLGAILLCDPDSAMGPALRVAAAQLREPRSDGVVVLQRLPRQT